MTVYLIRRLLWLPVLLVIVSMVTYALATYAGDPVEVMMGPRVNPEAVARVRHEMGLDRPFLVQYADYVWRVLHGDFGTSFRWQNRPVSQLIAQALPISLQINIASMLIGTAIGIPAGMLAAVKQSTWLDTVILVLIVGALSLPVLVIAPILQWFLARPHVVPFLQITTPALLPSGGWDGLFSRSAVLPVTILSIGPMAVFARQTRASMSDVLGQDYVRTARAKGLTERMVIVGHALRNALIPLFTIFGLMLGGMVGGTFMLELIFGIPGVGRLGVDAFFRRDYFVVLALTLMIAAAYGVINLLVDVGYGFLDPRIRRG